EKSAALVLVGLRDRAVEDPEPLTRASVQRGGAGHAGGAVAVPVTVDLARGGRQRHRRGGAVAAGARARPVSPGAGVAAAAAGAVASGSTGTAPPGAPAGMLGIEVLIEDIEFTPMVETVPFAPPFVTAPPPVLTPVPFTLPFTPLVTAVLPRAVPVPLVPAGTGPPKLATAASGA